MGEGSLKLPPIAENQWSPREKKELLSLSVFLIVLKELKQILKMNTYFLYNFLIIFVQL